MAVPVSTPVRDQAHTDREHLRLLAIFHFVAAGFATLGLLFLSAHYAIFHLVFADPGAWGPGAKGAPQLFDLFRWIYVVLAVWFVASGAANVLSGVFLRARLHRGFSLATAGLNCLHMPLGTILGVFTLIVLSRESVTRLYAGASTPHQLTARKHARDRAA